MKITSILLSLCFTASFASAQMSNVSDRFNGFGGNMKVGISTIINGFDNEPVEVIGNGYLDTAFCVGEVIFYQERRPNAKPYEAAHDVNIRLDIHRNELDVRLSSGIYSAPGNTIEEFRFKDKLNRQHIFRNINELSPIEGRNSGFYEILSDGKNYKLVRAHKVKVAVPNFNPILNTGSKDYVFEHDKPLYYIADGISGTFKPKTNFVTTEVCRGHTKPIEDFIKDNKINLKKESDVVLLFSYLNTL